MTREYTKRDEEKEIVYCACGCGLTLTHTQVLAGGKYATSHCVAKANLERLYKQAGTRHKDLSKDCLCGCGEEVPYANKIKDYYFVNKNHEKLYRKQQLLMEEEELNKNKNIEERTYCKNYKADHIACIQCYGQGSCEYRGCYANPKQQKNKNEVRKV